MYEKDIKDIKIKIDEIQQKIELNSMLKDIDINDLKMLTQNNAMVNNSINTLISKWDKVHSKLEEIEKKKEAQSEN
jgi:tetrahydromethanopterin S-methyltransferase subunit G